MVLIHTPVYFINWFSNTSDNPLYQFHSHNYTVILLFNEAPLFKFHCTDYLLNDQCIIIHSRFYPEAHLYPCILLYIGLRANHESHVSVRISLISFYCTLRYSSMTTILFHSTDTIQNFTLYLAIHFDFTHVHTPACFMNGFNSVSHIPLYRFHSHNIVQ
uniref:Uncharacterized protein n=1 Tax=Rhipicephalus microplus TaxID=6941 RepID=A0A6G5AJC6_RHIMP